MTSAFIKAAPLAAMFVAAPMAAFAQSAIMTDDSALRAGPGYNYPRVAYVPEDARVRIHGCLRAFSWCDVSWRSERGWIEAENLSYPWNNRYVTVEEWGPRIGLPVIAFSIENYWTRHYRDRPWWSQRYTWFERGDRWRDRDGRRDGDWRDDRRRGADRDDWRDRQRGDQRDERRGDQRQGRSDRDDDRGQNWRDRGAGERGQNAGQPNRGQDRSQRLDQGQRGGGESGAGQRGGGQREFGGQGGASRGGDGAPGRVPPQRVPGERM